MHIISFLINLVTLYWTDIALVLALVALLVTLYKRGRKDLVKKIIYGLVVQAEKQLGSKTGQEKYSLVVSELYNKLPLIVRFLYSRDELNAFIQEAAAYLKKQLDAGLNLKSYDQENTKPVIISIEKEQPVARSEIGEQINNSIQ